MFSYCADAISFRCLVPVRLLQPRSVDGAGFSWMSTLQISNCILHAPAPDGDLELVLMIPGETSDLLARLELAPSAPRAGEWVIPAAWQTDQRNAPLPQWNPSFHRRRCQPERDARRVPGHYLDLASRIRCSMARAFGFGDAPGPGTFESGSRSPVGLDGAERMPSIRPRSGTANLAATTFHRCPGFTSMPVLLSSPEISLNGLLLDGAMLIVGGRRHRTNGSRSWGCGTALSGGLHFEDLAQRVFYLVRNGCCWTRHRVGID